MSNSYSISPCLSSPPPFLRHYSFNVQMSVQIYVQEVYSSLYISMSNSYSTSPCLSTPPPFLRRYSFNVQMSSKSTSKRSIVVYIYLCQLYSISPCLSTPPPFSRRYSINVQMSVQIYVQELYSSLYVFRQVKRVYNRQN